ncbi:multidrug resistance protein A [Vibrio inusitatus NBRC 102082]|uniref:Multidrug resistance protein A n=1 Tax=Vibrio inusitatus NBRC 102082 TaxID=1219070 RepID=A0A4Y3HVL1_9VIBR|nr:efflux RND transporter periplasmic adaptor subunit [Vibrio inusitatus]GEA50782.1 multidrug resistance protein A [Vibrio inusitatus NBRC 102082]
MLEGLAIWALFIYILRLLGVPWAKPFKAFAYIGGGLWLGFVWIGLINYTPMDLSGGSVVQAPHIQLRPGNTGIKGKVKTIHIEPNSRVKKGDLIFELDSEIYEIARNKSETELKAAEAAYSLANEDIHLSETDYNTSLINLDIVKVELASARKQYKLERTTLSRYERQNAKAKYSVTESLLDEQGTIVVLAKNKIASIQSQISRSEVEVSRAKVNVEKSKLNLISAGANLQRAKEKLAEAEWNLKETRVHAPTDGFVTNFILREGQYVGILSRMQMYTDEKYVLMRVNHQAIRNVKPGQRAEFASPVYPGKVFSAEVQGIVEATGEAQASSMGREASVSETTGKNVKNKFHFVRLKLNEPEGYDIPVGAVGLAWVSGEKPHHFLSFLDVIRGIILRMKSQIYYVYSL